MMVIFTSRSEKKALLTVRRILDTFADRIGNDTWKTVITEEGLTTVRLLLRQRATKNMAVACHWIRSRSRSELVWIVGNRDKFGDQGIMPVNSTKKNHSHNEWESDWNSMPQMTPVLALAALLHDWGKANDEFQKKLHKKAKVGDNFRHEWISCRLIANLVASSGNPTDDIAWLTKLSAGESAPKPRVKTLQLSDEDALGGLPPIASAVCWLIVSHHRLPALPKEDSKQYLDTSVESFAELLPEIRGGWGYTRENGAVSVKFKAGTLEDSSTWQKQIRKWAKRALAEYENIVSLLSGDSFRSSMTYMRLSLMMADYFVSSQPAQANWQGNQSLYANTEKGILKQKLDEHLTEVAEQAMKILHRLPQMANRMEAAMDVRALKKKSPPPFAWQDRAAEKIAEARSGNKSKMETCGWFVVNMASTGCGKTIANAKIMRAISASGDELRYVLALGLRSLTLQTGDEYREKIGLKGDEMAVLVGDTAICDLHASDSREKALEDDGEIEHRDSLLDGDLDYIAEPLDDFLDVLFQQPAKAKKNKAFLCKPVVVATIDHLAAATETTRGGKYMLPFLRLMTSDLVIDEVDDFGPENLWAVARLVHLAGMLGRNVAISSATIPPDLAEALFCAYQKGRIAYGGFFRRRETIACVWCDEHKTAIAALDAADDARNNFHELHQDFVAKRVEKIQKQTVRRKAILADCRPSEEKRTSENNPQRDAYFTNIQEAAIALHDAHCLTDRLSGKRVSLGVIRMANIDPCVAVSQFLLASEWRHGYDVRLMTYHSRQTRLLRHEQEQYLDRVLKRKGDWQKDVIEKDPILRSHIDTSTADNLLFIVVATPVEEIGRDHDFDWAVIEPSSYRSIIQMAGRVLRHRAQANDIAVPNIAVMRYNLRGLQNAPKSFCCPGYETGGKYALASHDMKAVADEAALLAGINAVPRIQKPAVLLPKERLIDLEHQVMQDFNDMEREGLSGLGGYLDEYWWLTGLPQALRPFRDGRPEAELYYCYGDDGDELGFYERTKEGDWNSVSNFIKYEVALERSASVRLWLKKDFEESLRHQAKGEIGDFWEMTDLIKLAKKYGRISIPVKYLGGYEKPIYNDVFGMYRNKDK